MKKQKLILICLGIFFFLSSSVLVAQDNEGGESNFSIGVDGVSRYVWRGLNLGGSSPHLQPWVEYAFGESGLAIGAWGSYSLGLNAGAEADLYLSYSPVDWLNFTLTDYFFPADQPFERSDYFNYDSDETGHTLEAMLTIGGFETLPLYLTFAMNVYGADGTDENGDNYMAKYLEVGYSGSSKNLDYDLFAGFALDDPNTDAGGAGWYADKPGMINLGVTFSKEMKIADVAIPVFSSLIFNPEAGNMYIVFGVSF